MSDCSGNREQVEAGVDGEMCKLTAEAVSEKIVLLLKDAKKRKEYGERAAKKQITENVDADALKRLFQL